MHQQAQLLLIEDDYALASGIIEYLQSQLINIQHAATASAALFCRDYKADMPAQCYF